MKNGSFAISDHASKIFRDFHTNITIVHTSTYTLSFPHLHMYLISMCVCVLLSDDY